MVGKNVDILVGLQYGDEGKGRVVDYLAKNYSCVARFNGGPNAGHTVYVGGKDEPLKLNMVPSGIVHENVYNYIGPGCVLNMDALESEIRHIESVLGVKIGPDRLGISRKAHVILDSHIDNDVKMFQHLGTTKRGIGPAYVSKAERSGIRVEDECFSPLSEFIVRSDEKFQDELELGTVLCEGAQGFFLDLDHGNYPYVTSSNTLASHACTSLGFGVNRVRDVIGVFKAYTTAVGTHPNFKKWEIKDYPNISKMEFGTTTGRQREIGPLVISDIKKAMDVNGVTRLVMTKSDVLAGEDVNMLMTSSGLRASKNIKFNRVGDEGFFSFIHDIETFLGMDLSLISTGPKRNDWLLEVISY